MEPLEQTFPRVGAQSEGLGADVGEVVGQLDGDGADGVVDGEEGEGEDGAEEEDGGQEMGEGVVVARGCV